MTNLIHTVNCFTRREPLSAYLAHAEYFSSSSLRRFLRTGTVSNQFTEATTQTASLGDALHALLLEPDRFGSDFVRMDAGSSVSAESAEDLLSRTWLSNQQSLALHAMQKSVRYFTRAPLQRWLDAGEKELSIYWTDEHGTKWKARPDCFNDEVILELKTTADVRPKKFAKARRHFGYDLQAAHYLEAVTRLLGRTPRFLFISVESSRPHTVWLHELDTAAIGLANAQLTTARDRFRAALTAQGSPEAKASGAFS